MPCIFRAVSLSCALCNTLSLPALAPTRPHGVSDSVPDLGSTIEEGEVLDDTEAAADITIDEEDERDQPYRPPSDDASSETEAAASPTRRVKPSSKG